jgi:hypothetical protein
MQKIFNPMDFSFSFTDDWYSFDRKAGHKLALAERNRVAKNLRKQGWTVRTFVLKNQLCTRGGIGSGKPQIEAIVNCYGFNAYR